MDGFAWMADSHPVFANPSIRYHETHPNPSMKPKFRSLAAVIAPLTAVIVVSFAGQAMAASIVKANNADNLNLATSWVGGAVPGAADTAIWDATVAANQTLLLGADLSLGGINMTDSGGDVTINTGNILTLGASGITSAASKWVWINAPIALGANQIWNTPNNLHISNAISGAFSLTKNGVGTLVLGNTANTFSGGATLNAGTVSIGSGTTGSAGNLGAAGSTITLAGGTITNGTGGSNGSIVLNNNFVVNADSTINMGNRMSLGNATTARTITGSSKLTLNLQTTISRDDIFANMTGYAGTISFTGSGTARLYIVGGHVGAGFTNSTLELLGSANLQPQTNSGGNTVNIGKLIGTSATASLGGGSAGSPNYSVGGLGSDSVFGGGIRGNAALTKTGGATLTLTNSTILDYTGTTSVNAGVLVVNGAKTGAGNTSVNSGGALAGTGSIAGTTTVANGGILTPAGSVVGNLSFTNLTLASGSVYDVTFNGGNDTATVTGTLALNSGATVDVNGFATEGTYKIFTTNGATISGTASTALSVVDGDPGKIYSFSSDAAGVYLKISSSDPSNFWNVDGGNTWGQASNWTKGLVPNAAGANAKIGDGVGGLGGFFTPESFTINLDGVRTVGEIVFNEDGSEITIGSGTSGSLLMDNGSSTSNIVVTQGFHKIDAPVAVDAEGVAFDISDTFSFSVSGVISSSVPGGGLAKSGLGTLTLLGNNTYNGGTNLAAGVVAIDTATSLGDVTAPVRFLGGTVRILNDLTASRPYQVTGSNSAIIDTNGFNFNYGGVISPLSGGTGGIRKVGAGTLALSAVQNFTGTTQVDFGVLNLGSGSSINGGAANIAGNAGAQIVVDGGSLVSSAASNIGNGSLGLRVNTGSVSYNGGLNATSNSTNGHLVSIAGGTFSASSLTMGRTGLNYSNEPGAGSDTNGLYVNGGAASITGALSVGYNSTNVNSSASSRMDSGSLTVGGATLVGLNNGGRWSVLDINGGTFTSTHTATGVQLGSNNAGSALLLVRGTGTATVERILLSQIATSTSTSRVRVNAGSLYIGAGGIVTNANGGTSTLDVQLGGGLLGAKASWASSAPVSLNSATVTIKAADAADVANDIALSGVVSGTGGFTKTGAGALTLSGANTYDGATTVSAGKLVITGNQSEANGAVSVASGATLGGNGAIGGDVTLASGAVHQLAVAATTETQVTRVITGSLNLESGSILDLTAAAPVAEGSYILATANGGIIGAPSLVNLPTGVNGTVTVDGNSLKLTVASASAYDSWAKAAGLTVGVNDGPNQDPDIDGIANSLEFALGGNPMASSASILPKVAVTATNFEFTFNRNDESEAEITLAFNWGTNLITWPNTVAVGATSSSANGVTVTVVEGTEAGALDAIKVSVPRSNAVAGKLFGRLSATK